MAEELKSLDDLKSAVAGTPAAIAEAAPREPVRDALGRAYATGKRKDAVARVWVKAGSGKIVVNGKDMAAYFARPVLQLIVNQPFGIAGAGGAAAGAEAEQQERKRDQQQLFHGIHP